MHRSKAGLTRILHKEKGPPDNTRNTSGFEVASFACLADFFFWKTGVDKLKTWATT